MVRVFKAVFHENNLGIRKDIEEVKRKNGNNIRGVLLMLFALCQQLEKNFDSALDGKRKTRESIQAENDRK